VINDELILAAPSSSRDTISDFRLEKAKRLFGHGKSNGAASFSDAKTGCCRSGLHGASGCVRGRCWRVRASFGFTYGFIHAGNFAYWASLLDSERSDRVDSMGGFYKNFSIMGGFFLLYITGAGKYSIDALLSIAAP
jgi:hypothetical protein